MNVYNINILFLIFSYIHIYIRICIRIIFNVYTFTMRNDRKDVESMSVPSFFDAFDLSISNLLNYHFSLIMSNNYFD